MLSSMNNNKVINTTLENEHNHTNNINKSNSKISTSQISSLSPIKTIITQPHGSTKMLNIKKLMHASNERKRKKRMIEMIDQLVELLPMKVGLGRMSRIKRLEQLYQYILDLRNKNDGLMYANPSSVHGKFNANIHIQQDL